MYSLCHARGLCHARRRLCNFCIVRSTYMFPVSLLFHCCCSFETIGRAFWEKGRRLTGFHSRLLGLSHNYLSLRYCIALHCKEAKSQEDKLADSICTYGYSQVWAERVKSSSGQLLASLDGEVHCWFEEDTSESRLTLPNLHCLETQRYLLCSLAGPDVDA